MNGRQELIDEVIETAKLLGLPDDVSIEAVVGMVKAVLKLIDAAGIAMVPKEPDGNMVLAAGGAMGDLSKTVKLSTLRPYEWLRPQWDAMLKASPYAESRSEEEACRISIST